MCVTVVLLASPPFHSMKGLLLAFNVPPDDGTSLRSVPPAGISSNDSDEVIMTFMLELSLVFTCICRNFEPGVKELENKPVMYP